jgi:hypothetical protein
MIRSAAEAREVVASAKYLQQSAMAGGLPHRTTVRFPPPGRRAVNDATMVVVQFETAARDRQGRTRSPRSKASTWC